MYIFWSRTFGTYRLPALIIFGLCVTLCTCIVFALIIWAEPVADDWCRASLLSHRRGQNSGIFEYIFINYLDWSGRWAANGFIAFLLSNSVLPNNYPVLMCFVVGTEWFLFYWAIYTLIRNSWLALYYATLIAAVYWANMPSPQQGIFWISGGVENVLPLVLGALLFSFVLPRDLSATRRSTWIPTMGASLLAFVTPALQELWGAVLILVLSAITITAFLWSSPERKIWLTVWTAAVCGFVLVAGAPGNFARMDFEKALHVHSTEFTNYLVGTLRETSRSVYHYILPWFLDFKHWLLAVVVWLDPGVAGVRAKFSGVSSCRTIGALGIVWLSSVIMMFVIPIYSTTYVAPRTLDMIYGVFLAGWIVLAFLLAKPHPRFPLHQDHRITTLSLSLFLLSTLIATSYNTVTGLRDIISGRARLWNAEMNSRYEVLKTGTPNQDVVLPPIPANPPILSSWADIREGPEDSNYWVNQCVSAYFHVSSVRMSTVSRLKSE